MIGRTLGRYRITTLLGEGGTGAVWRAEDSLLGRDVALKLLAAELTRSASARERFIREARAASKLEHPAIAAVHDAGELDGQAWIDYQLVEGETLRSRLAAGPLPLPALLAVAYGVADALAHAHSRGVLHRDITAGNIMLRPDGSPVIVDFGLARSVADAALTTTGTTLGTAPYMPPEQWQGRAATPSSDLWSLGVVLYQAATGQLPFQGDAPEAVMYLVMNTDPQRPERLRPDLPRGFCRLMMRLLEKDPRDRLSNAAELAAAMGALEVAEAEASAPRAGGESVGARLGRMARRFGRRRFGPAEIGLLVVVLALAVAGVWMVRDRAEARRERVLAVLPLRNTSRDSVETAYLGEGLGQELVRRLSDAGGFRILPWTTTAAFDSKGRSPQALARALHADALLLGSFTGENERLQVLVELVDGRTGLQLWSERYVRVTSDLIALQTELATAVAEHVARSPDAERSMRIARTAPGNAEAYDLYIHGARYLQSADESEKALAEPMFQRAVDLDPTLAVAWVGLGAVKVDRYYSGAVGGERDLAEADSCFRRALALEPDLPAAARGLISLASERNDSDLCAELARDALRRHPERADALTTAGWGFTLGAIPELAVPALDRALEMDPNDAGADWYRVIALCWSGQDRRCLEAGKAHVRRFGEDAEVYLWMATSSAVLRNLREAQTYCERAVELGQPPLGPPIYLAVLYQATGQMARLRALLDSTTTKYRAMLEASPHDLRLRCEFTALLALKGDVPARDAEVEAIQSELRRGNRASGGSEPDIAFAAAVSGDLDGARRMTRQLAEHDIPLYGWWLDGTLAERGGLYFGGRVADFLRTEDYRGIRREAAEQHARRLRLYQPIVENALRR